MTEALINSTNTTLRGAMQFNSVLWAPPGSPLPVSLEPSRVPFVEKRTQGEMIAAYSPLVRQIVGGFQRRLPRHVLRDDLLAAGMGGLWDAVRKQLAEPSDRFDFYVRVRVRGAIVDELRAQDWLPRRARAAAQEAANSGDTARSTAPAVVRLDEISLGEHGRCLSSEEADAGEAAMDARAAQASLAKAVEQLPPRERYIVAEHYFRGVKFKDLGAELGVSEPRISQLHARAMRRLKDLMPVAS